MRISKFVFPFEKKSLVYNALNNGLVRLNSEIFPMFLENRIDSVIFNKYPNEMKKLQDTFYINSKDFDDLQYIRYYHNREKFDTSVLGLTIAPTLNCNFHCFYCVQDIDKKNTISEDMTFETSDKLISFIEKNFDKNKFKLIHITWYGGEPLLRFDIIKYILEKIHNFAKTNNINLRSSIVTNGYLLNKDYAQFLSEHNVKTVQITIDGPENVHNTRRRHKNNGDTFKVIFNNISEVAELFDNISIRINVDKSNIAYLDELSDYINTSYKGQNNISYYIAPVASDTLEHCNFSSLVYTYKEFSKIKHDYAIKTNVQSNVLYPKILYGSCGAVKRNSFVISPSGSIYKCWNEIGIDGREIGDLDNNIYNLARFIKWVNYDPIDIEGCSSCKFVPICMGGGCPYRVLFPNEANVKPACTEYKYLIEEFIFGWLEKQNIGGNGTIGN